ncbi:MAG: glycerol 3-phosphate dehydrogenase [Flavobacteriales bacterium]|nr:NAD(P)-dependent glycerol-3-phosphate dehydrogenase [Bacteroidales bacterium AH-315-I05]PCJ88792.1 MAG: glycerol 3-phosphate dehydrogenase [Flavobacteriales bacterium]
MNSNNSKNDTVGVLGAGSFGVAVSNLLAKNRKVLLFTRRQEVADEIKSTGKIRGMKMDAAIEPTTDLQLLSNTCKLIFIVVRSAHFREMMKTLSPLMQPDHILIHGTKGFDVALSESELLDDEHIKLSRGQIRTMSEVVLEESVVRRVGVFSGPNLAKEIVEGQLAGTVIASKFDEVIHEGRKALENPRFKVYESYDVTGIELAGALKNIMALAAGALSGLGYGQNARSMIISRGLAEMAWLGKVLGGNPQAFMGVAGVGDLVATCSSELSRNFTVGSRIAKGEKLQEILSSMNDVVEGLYTVKIVNGLANYYQARAPITQTLFKVLFKDMPIEEGIDYLMNYPIQKDVGFL